MIKKIIYGGIAGILIVAMALGLAFYDILTIPNPQPCVVKLQVESAWGGSWEGSGVFIADDLILTAGHMVEDANKITVTWPCDYNLPALSWYQEDSSLTDLGFIEVITPEVEPTAIFADAIVGETVRVLGNSLGYSFILTEGIVSAINIASSGDFREQKNVVVIDAAVNPGNSGSPVYNKDNEILGILVRGFRPAQGMNIIIPARICELSLAKYKAIQELKEVG